MTQWLTKKLTFRTVFTLLVSENSGARVCLHASLHLCPEVLCCAEVFVEESHQLFGFLRLLPCLYSLSLHRSSDVLPGCLSLFACDASQLLLYNGLLLLIPEQAHTHSFIYKPVAKPWFTHCSSQSYHRASVFCPLFLSLPQVWFTLEQHPGKNESSSNLRSLPLWEL